jgi:hypothetical protein
MINLEGYRSINPVNESLKFSPLNAFLMILREVREDKGWISVPEAVNKFTKLTGLDEYDKDVDRILHALHEMGHLYQENIKNPNERGEEIVLSTEIKELPHQDLQDHPFPRGSASESEEFSVKKLGDFL